MPSHWRVTTPFGPPLHDQDEPRRSERAPASPLVRAMFGAEGDFYSGARDVRGGAYDFYGGANDFYGAHRDRCSADHEFSGYDDYDLYADYGPSPVTKWVSAIGALVAVGVVVLATVRPAARIFAP